MIALPIPRRRLIGAGALVLFAYATVFLVCHSLRSQGSPMTIVLVLSVTALNIAYSALYFINEFRHDRIVSGRAPVRDASKVRRRRRYLTWYWVVVANLSQLFAFAFLFESLYRIGGKAYFTFEREISYLDWLLYTIDCTFNSVFDLAEIFDVHLRNIEHHGLIGGLIVASARLLIYSLLVAAVLRQWNKWRLVRETVAALDNAPQMAGRRLIRLGEEALPRLQRALGDRDRFEADHEDEAIVRDEHSAPLIELLVRNLTVGSESERQNAATVLGLLAAKDPSRDPYFLNLVRAAKDDASVDVRIAAIDSLGRIEDPRVLRFVRARLEDDTPELRARAARVLGRRAENRAVSDLARLLEDPESMVRVASARALGRIGDREARPVLEGALEHEDPSVRLEAVFSLAHFGEKRVVPALVRLLDSSDRKLQLKALDCIAVGRSNGGLCAKQAASAIDPLLRSRDAELRARATTVLGRIDARRASRQFMGNSRDSDPLVRRAQMDVVLALADDSTVEYLSKATRDSDAVVRERAIDGLAELRSPAAVDALLKVVRSGEAAERLHALRALADMGDVAPASSSEGEVSVYECVLEVVRNDADPHVRRQALRSLRWLAPERARRDARRLLEDPTVCAEAAWVLGHGGTAA